MVEAHFVAVIIFQIQNMMTSFVKMLRLFGAHFVAVIILKIQNMITSFVVAMGYIYNYTYITYVISLMQIAIVVNTGLLNHQFAKYDL